MLFLQYQICYRVGKNLIWESQTAKYWIKHRITFFLENIIYNELISRDYEVFVGKTYKGEIDFVVINGKKKCFIKVAYYLSGQQTIDKEFGAFKPIRDASPKYVLSMDRLDFFRDGISHVTIIDFLLGTVNTLPFIFRITVLSLIFICRLQEHKHRIQM